MSVARRRLRLVPVALVFAAIIALSFALAGGGTSHSPRRATHSSAARAQRPATPVLDSFRWPFYGFGPTHRRYFGATIRPPLHRRWSFFAGGLLEFPPVIDRGALYQLSDSGIINGLDKETGKHLWSRTLGKLSASSPAVGNGVLYATVLDDGNGTGRVAAVSETDGHVVWQRELPSPSESSPLYHAGTIYFGTQGGTVYALDARDGSTRWTYTASGSVKGSPTLYHGLLYFGDYGHEVQAVSASDGHQVWSAAGSDSFYATVAVAFGRVYIGDTSGDMYAFDARTGNRDWSSTTGNDVYASAAVMDQPGVGPTIYVGSYDGTFYALDAASGATRWTYAAAGRISGSATIVGRIVYFANLGNYSTTGLDVRTGHAVWHWSQGSFDPVVSDGKRLYVSAYNSIDALDPSRPPSTTP